MISKTGKANKMTEKIIISKELNEWLEGYQWLLLNRDKWEVEEDELFYICIPEPHDRNGYLAKDIGLEFFLKAPNQKRYFWTQEEIDKHEVAKHLEYFKKKVEK